MPSHRVQETLHAPQRRDLGAPATRGLALALVLASTLLGCSEHAGTAPVAPPSVDDYSSDARILAAELAQGTFLEARLVAEIEEALERARALDPVFANIHAFPEVALDRIIVRVTAPITEQWAGGGTSTGDSELDGLAAEFDLRSVKWVGGRVFLLRFGQSLNARAVAELYAASSSVDLAEPVRNRTGDGNRIWAFEKGDAWHLVFSEGWGDCRAACTFRNYFYVTVTAAGKAELVEERAPDATPVPAFFRWNIPPRYPATVFEHAGDLLEHLASGSWWERRHAIESGRRLLTALEPEDPADDLQAWASMRTDLLADRAAFIDRLHVALDDPDRDVRASARSALDALRASIEL